MTTTLSATTDAKCQFTDQQWFDAWVKAGYNQTKAYKSLKPDVTVDSAAVGGMRRHKIFKEGNVYKCLEDKLLENVNKLLDSKDEKIKLAMTKDQLDRFKGKAKESLDVTTKGEKIAAVNVMILAGKELDEYLKKQITQS